MVCAIPTTPPDGKPDSAETSLGNMPPHHERRCVMITVLSSSTPKARKAHTCDSCMGEITPGTTYRRAWCVDGGEAWTWKSHLSCHTAGLILYDLDIRGDEDCFINVSDMDREDRELIYAADPETFHAVWPDHPAPGKPTPTTKGGA